MLRRDRQGGFTLVELSVSIAILGIVMSALTGAMLLALKSTAEANDALGEAGDVQLAAAYFPNDVAGSNPGPISWTCATASDTSPPLITLAGPDFNPADLSETTRVISYVVRTIDGVTEVDRLSCGVPGTPPPGRLTPTSEGEVRVADQIADRPPPTATCQNAAGADVACDNAAAVQATLRLTLEGDDQPTRIIGRRSTS